MISGVIDGSGAEFAEGITRFVRDNLDYCFHSIANEWIKIDGDTAVGELYVLAHMTAGGQDVMTGGRYLDKYERQDGSWKIKSRIFVVDWNKTSPTTLNLEGMANRGCWGRADRVYALWEKRQAGI